jgi:excisionase family DNA binding protein
MQNFKDVRAFLKAVKAGDIPPARTMTPKEAMKELGVSRQSIDYLLAKGEIDGWRAGRFMLIDSKTVEAYAKGV